MDEKNDNSMDEKNDNNMGEKDDMDDEDESGTMGTWDRP